jgi:hypothetical protein
MFATSLGSVSTFSLDSTNPPNQSSYTILKLVESYPGSIPFLKESKSHITLNNFDRLINQTPFKKFNSRSTPSLQVQNQLKHTPQQKSLSFGLSHQRTKSTKSPVKIIKSLTTSSLLHETPKSRFLEESQRKKLDKNNGLIEN